MVMALAPLHKKYGIKRLVISTYQSVTGTGKAAVEQMEDERNEGSSKNMVYKYPIDKNCIPHCDVFLENGYTKEEMKMQNEGRKIMGHPDFLASVTCVRVPVYRAHSVAISAEFVNPVTVEGARAALELAPGIEVIDQPDKKLYPMPLNAAEKYFCQVGRIRKDCAMENGLCFWVSGDQLLKGAALNAVQIAEAL